MCLNASRACENFVGYIGRFAVFFLSVAGIVLSYLSMNTCEFLSFENLQGVPWRELQPPFDTSIAANVGIFHYEVLESSIPADVTDGCIPYEKKFFDLIDDQEALVAAQCCAVAALVLAGLGTIINLLEACACNFGGSFVITSILFLAAAGTQAGTFSMIAEPSLCFESSSEQQCSQEVGTYLSVAACLAYFFASVLLCCFPRPDPFCCPAPERRTGTNTKVTRTVIHQQAGDTPSGQMPPPQVEQNEPSPPPKKPKGKKGKKAPVVEEPVEEARPPVQEDIQEEEFDESPPPPEGAQRVDVKEKAFPDGSREVTETTFFKDGSRAVRTIVHYPDGSKSEKTQVFDD